MLMKLRFLERSREEERWGKKYLILKLDGVKMIMVQSKFAGWCKGSTNDSDSFCLGSNPSPAVKS